MVASWEECHLYLRLEDISGRRILLLSDGTSQLDMTRLLWARLPRPTHPLDRDITWTPQNGLYGDNAEDQQNASPS